MPFLIVRNDITRMTVDAIVNAAKPSLLGGGGVDGAIHAAAGPELLAECRTLGGCQRGEAKITGAYALPCRYVIHTVGPVWEGGNKGEEAILASCYRSSLALAAEHGCESVAFPLISAGIYGYPQEQAIRVAVRAIEAFLGGHDMTVYLVLHGRGAVDRGRAMFPEIQEYIDDHYVEAHTFARPRWDADADLVNAPVPESAPLFPPAPPRPKAKAARPREERAAREESPLQAAILSLGGAAPAPADLDALLRQPDESFQQMLLRKIDERGMTDAECYKKANLDRKLFSKIRKDVHYRPSKPTAIAFAVALELDIDETRSLLEKAGYALSGSSKADLIVRYFIERGNYNIFEINEVLFFYDQSLLGA